MPVLVPMRCWCRCRRWCRCPTGPSSFPNLHPSAPRYATQKPWHLHLSTFRTPAPSHLPHLTARIRRDGPITVADFIDFALYHPEHGYYSRAPRRSGREGDFYTSVDTGPLFGEMIAVQLAEMWDALRQEGAERFDLVEAGAGDGRLTRDMLDAAAAHHRDLYEHVRVTLVERSPAARAQHPETLRSHRAKHASSTERLPTSICGAIVANELLDAFPVHVVVQTPDGLREIYVSEADGQLTQVEGPLSAPVAAYVADGSVPLTEGAQTEIGLRAIDWIGLAADALDRGFLLLFDYAVTEAELYSNARTTGTLTTYRKHIVGATSWLSAPGVADITSHVNLTAVSRAAEAAGLVPLGVTDQTYFLMSLGIAERMPDGTDTTAVSRRLAAKTLLLPGGLGSTIKVFGFQKGIRTARLRGFSSPRVT